MINVNDANKSYHNIDEKIGILVVVKVTVKLTEFLNEITFKSNLLVVVICGSYAHLRLRKKKNLHVMSIIKINLVL